MAIPHARAGEVFNVSPLGDGLAAARTHVLVRSEGLEIIRLVVPQGKEIPSHAAHGEITVQCLEGRVAFTSRDVRRELSAGDMLFLDGDQPHSLSGVEDASVLLTITFPRESPRSDRSVRHESASPRGGRVDFDSAAAIDPVDEADQESFPASDPPGFIYCDTPKHYCDEPEPPGAASPQPRENGLASRRGGRVDFDSALATDLVDQASQESFPASDAPGFIYCKAPSRDLRAEPDREQVEASSRQPTRSSTPG